jgi:hypothetical protein
LQEKLCGSESSQAVRANPEKEGWWQDTELESRLTVTGQFSTCRKRNKLSSFCILDKFLHYTGSGALWRIYDTAERAEF